MGRGCPGSFPADGVWLGDWASMADRRATDPSIPSRLSSHFSPFSLQNPCAEISPEPLAIPPQRLLPAMPHNALEAAVRAAVDGNLRPLRKLSKRMDVRRGRGINGRSMLHFAAKSGLLDFSKFLVEELGFDVNFASAQGETPILVATEADDGEADIVPVLRYLLDRGGDPAAPDNKGYTPLHNAAEFGHHEAVKLLLSKGAPVDPINSRGTPQHLAAAMDHEQTVKILLEHGAGPNRVVSHVLSPLMMACCGHSLKCMKLLVEAGADVNFKSPAGRSVLFQAVDDGITDIVKFLLDAGADPNIDDGDGKTPIMIAAAREQRELVEILLPRTKPIPSMPDWSVNGIIVSMKYLQSKPQVCQNISKTSGDSPVKAAAIAPNSFEAAIRATVDGNLHLLREIASTMDLKDVRGFKGRNLLHFAADVGHLDLCRFLVEESGFDANSTSAEYETAILVATGVVEDRTNNIVPVLRYLLNRGCDPTTPNDKGYTPLHNAAEYGHHEAVRVLLSKGVPVDPIDCRGTPLHLAASKDHDRVVKILLEHGADPNRVAKRVLSPLAMACFGHSFKCMKLLVEAGADVNLKGPIGQPVFFNAVDDGLTDIVKFLLEAGADPNIHDEHGKFPIMLAAAREQRELVEILFPRTKPILSVPDWSVDGIIRAMKCLQIEPQINLFKDMKINSVRKILSRNGKKTNGDKETLLKRVNEEVELADLSQTELRMICKLNGIDQNKDKKIEMIAKLMAYKKKMESRRDGICSSDPQMEVCYHCDGIPNSISRYKEDQKVIWHETPFEERIEKALIGAYGQV